MPLATALVLATSAAAPALAIGDVAIGPPLLIANASPVSETTIAIHAGPKGVEVLTGAIWWPNPLTNPHGPDRPLHYAISPDGGVSWPTHGALLWPDPIPGHTTFGYDPVAVTDPRTGRMWIACGFQANQIWVWRKEPGSLKLQPPALIGSFSVRNSCPDDLGFANDKPILAVGPAPDHPDRTYLYAIGTAGRINNPNGPPKCATQTRELRVQRSEDFGASWQHDPLGADGSFRTGFQGFPTSALVTPSGELLVLHLPFQEDSQLYLIKSADGGATWSKQRVSVTGPIQTRTDAMTADNFNTCVPNTSGALAVDPTTGYIYAVFEAAQTSFPDFYANPDPGNVDVFISRSTDGGASFTLWTVLPGVPGHPWSDEMIPAMVFDGCGGLNVMYYSSITEDPDAPSAQIHVCYARIASVNPARSPATAQQVLTLNPFDTNIDESGPGDKELGDYQQIAASGGHVFLCYMSTSDPDGRAPARRYYVQQITICPPDRDGDLMLTSDDVLRAFESGVGDFNQDGSEDPRDYVAFLGAYASGCP